LAIVHERRSSFMNGSFSFMNEISPFVSFRCRS
jgi:hypothetical protein